MAYMDLSPALIDPFTATRFDVYRRVQVKNAFAEVAIDETLIPARIGVLYADGENKVDRRPEAQTQVKTISIITKFALRGVSLDGGKTYLADEVKWRGERFIVDHVEDYSNYGPGFVKAMLTAIQYLQQAPITDYIDVTPLAPTQIDSPPQEPPFGGGEFGGGGF